MNAELRVFDMSRHERLIATEGRISGTFVVLGSAEKTIWITAHDVTLWDEHRLWGGNLGSKDFKASVTNGIADISTHMLTDRFRAEVDEVKELLLELLVMIAQAFTAGVGSVVDGNGVTFQESRETKA